MKCSKCKAKLLIGITGIIHHPQWGEMVSLNSKNVRKIGYCFQCHRRFELKPTSNEIKKFIKAKGFGYDYP